MSQIFISYRRDGGEVMAQILYEKLSERGYTVFYDVESLKGGRFDSKLLLEIEKAEDFLLVLPPHGLDRCVAEEDWVRQEIRCAIANKKNIIPVMLRGFSFPTDLPEDISEISRYNGVNFGTMEFFDAKIRRVLERLKSVSVLGDQTTEKESAAISGYESFRQRLMLECEELLENAQHHWSKIVADSGSFAPIEHPVDRARIRLLLEDIEKWKEKKKEFEMKANSSIDIYGTAYIQDIFHRMEEELTQIAPYEEVLLQYAALFAIEEELYALSLQSREDYETLVALRDRLEALPEEIASEMRSHAREILDTFWRDYENQLTFEKGAALLEQMLLNLSFGMEQEEPTFALSELATVRSDVEITENILQRFDALYAQCAPEEGSERTPLFVEKYQKYIDRIPVLKLFVERGKVFIVAGSLCEDVAHLSEETHLTADAIDALLARCDGLSTEAAMYVDAAVKEQLLSLAEAAKQTASLLETAERLSAERHDEAGLVSDVPYSYEAYDAAYERAFAVEAWAEACLALEEARAAMEEKRFFTEADNEKMRACFADATALLSDPARPTAAQMQEAHALEEKLVAKSDSGVFDPETVTALHAEFSALSEAVRALISPAQAEALAFEMTVLAALDEVTQVRDWLNANRVQLVFENHPTVVKSCEQTVCLRERLTVLEAHVQTLGERFTEIKLPMEELRADMQAADEFVASTEGFFSCYTLYEWQLAHPDILGSIEENMAELKEVLVSFRAKKSMLGAYDLHGETKRYYTEAAKALRKVKGKKIRKTLGGIVFPLVVLALLGALIAANVLFRHRIVWKDYSSLWVMGYIVMLTVTLVVLRRVPFLKNPLFLLPAIGFTLYGFWYTFPYYLTAMDLPFAYLSKVVGVALCVIFLAAFLGKGTGFARFFRVIAVLVLIFTPLVAFLYPLLEAYGESSAETLLDFLERLTRMRFTEYVIEGGKWLGGTLIAAGLWMEDYVGTALTNFSILFWVTIIVKRACRRIVKKRSPQVEEDDDEDDEDDEG